MTTKASDLFLKNCFTCRHLSCDLDDREYGSSQWFICDKGEYEYREVKSDKMYDDAGKETNYLSRYKRCHEFPESVSFNGVSYVGFEKVLKKKVRNVQV